MKRSLLAIICTLCLLASSVMGSNVVTLISAAKMNKNENINVEQVQAEEFLCDSNKNEMLDFDYETELATYNSDGYIESSIALIAASDSVYYNTVRGTLQWIDDDGNYHPLQYTKIAVCAYMGYLFPDQIICTGYSDVNGAYYFLYRNDAGLARNLYIRVYAQGENSIVVRPGDYNEYVGESNIYNVAAGGTVTINFSIDMSEHLGQAFQISQAVIVAARYAKVITGSNLEEVVVMYPCKDSNGNKDIAYYTGNTIRLGEGFISTSGAPRMYAAWDVIMHEYGHHMTSKMKLTKSPGGDHWITDNLATYPNLTKNEAVRLAWSEALANLFSGMAQQYYSSSLQGIKTVGDTVFTGNDGHSFDYNTSFVKFAIFDETEDGGIIKIGEGEKLINYGEACEGSILSVLWDLFDDDEFEEHDNISLGTHEFWSILSRNWTYIELFSLSDFSEFVQNFYAYYSSSNIYKSHIGSLLSYYGMAPIDIKTTYELSITSNPIFKWTANGTSGSLPNNNFDLVFYDSMYNEILKITDIAGTSKTLSLNQWNTIMNSGTQDFYVAVVGYQMDNSVTGGYISEFVKFTVPSHFTFSSTMRYLERIVDLKAGKSIDYHVTFQNAGTKIIQTFGQKDAYLYLYNANGTTLLASNDDAGYGANALINYSTTANTSYIIRVKFFSTLQSGKIKLGITPSSFTGPFSSPPLNTYENIWGIFGITQSPLAPTVKNETLLTRYSVTSAGTYTFYTDRYSASHSYPDMYMYLVDPTSTEPCLYSDDDGGNLQAKITTTLKSGIEYLVICSQYSILSESVQFKQGLRSGK